MRDDTQFKVGKRPTTDSLEFVGAKKKSLFAQYTTQFQQRSAPTATNVAIPTPTPEPARMSARMPVRPPALTPVQPQSTQFTDTQASAEVLSSVIITPKQNNRQAVTYNEAAYTVEDSVDVPLPSDVDTFLDKKDAALQGLKESKITKQAPDAEKAVKKVTKPMAVLSALVFIVGLSIITASIVYIRSSGPAISGSLKASIKVPTYELLQNSSFTIDKSTVAKGENNSIVYVANQNDTNAKFVVSQQAIPELIKTDEQFQAFLSQTDKYASLDTKIGKAYFTKPANIGEDISVVVKTDTTLIFIRGNGATEEAKWVELLSLLDVVN